MSSNTAALAGKRMPVTGGAGFIGSRLVDHPVSAGCDEILVVDNMPSGRPDHRSQALRSDRIRLREITPEMAA